MKVRFKQSAVAVVAATLASIIAPPETLSPSAWAQKHLVVPDGPHAGELWDATLTPHLIEPLDMMAPDSGVNEMAVRKGAQTGFSMMMIAGTGHMIDQDPCRAMLVQPTTGALSDFVKEKLNPAIEATAPLAAKVKSQVSRAGDASTADVKRYAGGSLSLAIANSSKDLRSKTVKRVYLDEVDEYPDDLDGQGDPMAMITARQISFLTSGDWLRVSVSTPTIKGQSRIDKMFHAGDQRYWTMPCPGCGTGFRFVFDRKQFKFKDTYPYDAYYVTPCCGSTIEGREKIAVYKRGAWVAEAPRPGAYPSYHFDAMSSPFVPWNEVAAEYVAADGDPAKLKTFENLYLGLPFDVRGDAPDHVRLMERRDGDLTRDHIPPMGLVLVGAADVQMNGIWYVIKAYGPDRQSWRVDAGYFAGSTDDPYSGPFAKLEELRQRRWPDAFGSARPVDAFGVDSGYRSHVVYTWVRGKPATFALKGLDGWSKPAIGQPSPVDIDFNGRRIRNGAMVWGVGTWSLKGAFYADLRKEPRADGVGLAFPPGYCHFGGWMDEVYFRQITSEYLASETFRGRERRIWKIRNGEENHLLDCEIYGAALADYLGVSRMTPEDWTRLIGQRATPELVKNPDMFAPAPIQAQTRSRPAPAPVARGDEADGLAQDWWN